MREKIRMVVVLVVLSALSALMLAFIDHIAADRIERNRVMGFKTALLSVLSVPAVDKGVEETFASTIRELKTEAGTIYLSARGKEEGGAKRAAFKVSGPGFWGPVSMLLAVDMKDLSILGLEILEQEETPGLGARIEEPEFRERFEGKSLDLPLRVRSQAEGMEPNDVEAITGATISSKAVERIINEASRPYMDAIRSMKLD